MTSSKFKRLLAAGLVSLAVMACGGTGAVAPTDDAASAQPAGGSETVAEVTVAPLDAAPVADTTLNACELVTAEDVAVATATDAVAAGAFEATGTTLSPARSECTYEGDFGRIIVELTPEDGANLYDAAYGAYDGLEEIAGLGDGAFWSAQNHRSFVWQGTVTLMLTMFLADDDAATQVTEAIGKAALAKI